jgi:hypothetical protein
MLKRAATCLAGLWCGMLIGVGLVGAPAGFAVAPLAIAGRSAARMFAIEAHASLAIAVVLLLVLRRLTPRGGIDTNLLLVLGSLFCTVTGYFVLQPLMAAARGGPGVLSFGALHGLSAAVFALKAAVVLALAWRLTSA